MGDININLLKNENDAKYFNSNISNFNLKQIVTFPTRVTDDSESLIDVVCVSNNIVVKSCETSDMYNLTDHMLVSCELSLECDQLETGKPKFFRNYNNINYEDFNNDATSLHWNTIYEISDINLKVEKLNENIIYLFDKHAPLMQFSGNKRNPPYITYTIKQMIKLKHKAHKKYLKNKNANNKEYYLDLRKYTSEAIKREKIAYMQFTLQNNKNNQKKLWHKMRDWGINSTKSSNICNLDEQVTSNDINNFFINIAGNNNVSLNLVNYYENNMLNNIIASNKFKFKNVTCQDIYRILKTIKSESLGVDNINIKMIRIVLPHIIDVLVHIINESLCAGVVPDIWKIAKVIPCPKLENSENLIDLRPLSILPALSKFIEKIVAYQLKCYLDVNSILPNLQSGFRSKYSTQTALLKIVDDISRAIDKREVTFLILLDQSKAFDLVNFELLIAKLKFIGLDVGALTWFKSYVTNRMQVVKYNEILSDVEKTKSGVPQGSVIGPLLFAIFIFDVADCMRHCSYHLYADDIQLYMSSTVKNIDIAEQNINYDLKKLSDWCKDNGLKLNPNKTVAICIGNQQNRINVNLNTVNLIVNETNIPWVKSVKSLGLIIDENLNFESHVNKLVSVSYMKLKMLNRLKYSLNSETKLKLVQNLIYPGLEYCSVVYYEHLTQFNKNKMQRIQNACMRFVYCIPFREHVTPYFNNEFKISTRFKYLYCVFLYKLVRYKCPPYLFQLLILTSQRHDANIRSNNNYSIPQHTTSKFKSSFSYVAPKLLNTIIALLSMTETSFRRSLKLLLSD